MIGSVVLYSLSYLLSAISLMLPSKSFLYLDDITGNIAIFVDNAMTWNNILPISTILDLFHVYFTFLYLIVSVKLILYVVKHIPFMRQSGTLVK